MPVKTLPSPEPRKSAGAPRPERSAGLRPGLFRPQNVWGLALLLLVVVFYPVAPRLTPDLSDRPEYLISWEQLHATPPPDDAPAGLVEQILRGGDVPERLSLVEPGLAERLAGAFTASPWVARVRRVSVARQGRVDLDIEYRRPVLLVETSRGFYPVDALGVLLPPGDFTAASLSRWPIVRNIKRLPQGPAGEPWGDVVVECAARLAAALAPQGDLDRHWTRFELEAILAPVPATAQPSPTELSFRLQTAGGSEVLWGPAPEGADSATETLDKLKSLERAASSMEGLDGPGGPFLIDLRRPEVVSYRPFQAAEDE